MEIFFDGSMRNVWAERDSQDAFHEADVRFGVRSSWDTLFRWNPVAEIKGTVFKDLDGNGIRGNEEPGVPQVRLNIGKDAVTTDHQGRYAKKVRAQKVVMNVDLDTLPQGSVFSTQTAHEIDIVHGQREVINFGLTTQSNIYGVVYFDKNSDGQLDPQDVLIPKAKVTLDKTQTIYTGVDGIYRFDNILEGPHEIFIDVNSLPLEYLPTVKLEHSVDVQEGLTYTVNFPLKKK